MTMKNKKYQKEYEEYMKSITDEFILSFVNIDYNYLPEYSIVNDGIVNDEIIFSYSWKCDWCSVDDGGLGKPNVPEYIKNAWKIEHKTRVLNILKEKTLSYDDFIVKNNLI